MPRAVASLFHRIPGPSGDGIPTRKGGGVNHVRLTKAMSNRWERPKLRSKILTPCVIMSSHFYKGSAVTRKQRILKVECDMLMHLTALEP